MKCTKFSTGRASCGPSPLRCTSSWSEDDDGGPVLCGSSRRHTERRGGAASSRAEEPPPGETADPEASGYRKAGISLEEAATGGIEPPSGPMALCFSTSSVAAGATIELARLQGDPRRAFPAGSRGRSPKRTRPMRPSCAAGAATRRSTPDQTRPPPVATGPETPDRESGAKPWTGRRRAGPRLEGPANQRYGHRYSPVSGI